MGMYLTFTDTELLLFTNLHPRVRSKRRREREGEGEEGKKRKEKRIGREVGDVPYVKCFFKTEHGCTVGL